MRIISLDGLADIKSAGKSVTWSRGVINFLSLTTGNVFIFGCPNEISHHPLKNVRKDRIGDQREKGFKSLRKVDFIELRSF